MGERAKEDSDIVDNPVFTIKTNTSLVAELSLQGVNVESLKSKFGNLSGVVDTDNGITPALTVSIHGNDGLPVAKTRDSIRIEELAKEIKDVFQTLP